MSGRTRWWFDRTVVWLNHGMACSFYVGAADRFQKAMDADTWQGMTLTLAGIFCACLGRFFWRTAEEVQREIDADRAVAELRRGDA